MAGSVLGGGTPPTSQAVVPMAGGSAGSVNPGMNTSIQGAPPPPSTTLPARMTLNQPNLVTAQSARPPMSGAPGAQPNPGAAIGGAPHPATNPAVPAQMRPRPLMARGQGMQ